MKISILIDERCPLPSRSLIHDSPVNFYSRRENNRCMNNSTYFTPCVHGCQPPSLPACPAVNSAQRLGNSYSLNIAYQGMRTLLARTKTRSLHDPSLGGRHHSRNYAHPYAPQGRLYIYIYIYIANAPCCIQRRVRKHAARVIPFHPRSFLFERQSRHAMIFHFPRHPPWNIDPRGKRGLKSIRPSRELESPVGGYPDRWS